MVVRKKNKKAAVTAAATFGAAITSLYLAPELQADIVDITWNGGNASASHAFSGGTFNPATQNIDQVVDGTNTAVDFVQYNDAFGGVGRSMFVGGTRAIASVGILSLGQSIDGATFSGTGGLTGTTFDGTGYQYVGFRDNNANVGWFRVDFTAGGALVYSVGEYGTTGETLTAGGTAGVPEPGSMAALSLLAIGAVGRRKRKNS